VPTVLKSGSLNLTEPSGTVQGCAFIAATPRHYSHIIICTLIAFILWRCNYIAVICLPVCLFCPGECCGSPSAVACATLLPVLFPCPYILFTQWTGPFACSAVHTHPVGPVNGADAFLCRGNCLLWEETFRLARLCIRTANMLAFPCVYFT